MRYLGYLLLLLIVLYALTGIRQVQPGERLVVRRFGRVLEYRPEPGLWIGLPWGMDRVDRVAVDVMRSVSVGSPPEEEETDAGAPRGQLLTGDHNLVNIQVSLQYTVRDDEVVDFVLQMDRVDGLVTRAAESALAEWMAGRTVDDVLLNGKATLPRWLVVEAQKRIEPYHLGIQFQQASIKHLAPPGQVQAAFKDVTSAEAEIRTRVYEAEQEAHRSVLSAQADKFRMEQSVAPYVRDQLQMAWTEVRTFEERLERGQNKPDAQSAQWFAAMEKVVVPLNANGQLHRLPDLKGIEMNVSWPWQMRWR